MSSFKGIVALDIDGTITKNPDILEKDVEAYLLSLLEQKWQLVFVTGRTFAFAAPLFSKFQKTYFLAVQNGAELFEMPSCKSLDRHYMSAETLPHLLNVFAQENVGLLIESGKKYRDVTYYCPDDFSYEEKEYLNFRQTLSKDKWVALDSMHDLPISDFAVGKFFSDEKKAQKMAQILGNTLIIKDPFRPGYYIGHINQTNASKAQILKSLGAPYIACGDDMNDLEMLKMAKIKIVMPHAPEPLKKIADIIANDGLISALKSYL